MSTKYCLVMTETQDSVIIRFRIHNYHLRNTDEHYATAQHGKLDMALTARREISGVREFQEWRNQPGLANQLAR